MQVVDTTCVMSEGESCASCKAFRAAVTASATPSVRKTLQSSPMVGARSMFAIGWSTVPIALRVSIPVYWFIVRILAMLCGYCQCLEDIVKDWGRTLVSLGSDACRVCLGLRDRGDRVDIVFLNR